MGFAIKIMIYKGQNVGLKVTIVIIKVKILVF